MLDPTQLAALRQDYAQRGLRRAELDPDPVRQFNVWLDEAVRAELLEPNAMILATVDAAAQPWTRTVLLKVCDERGFTFFTNYAGTKARHLAANARAAVTFWWGALERQVHVTGTVGKIPHAESARYFHTRPRASQLGAWASEQSVVLRDRAQLEQQFQAVQDRFGAGDIPLPEQWGGYCLAPETVEFWQGRRSRLHDRLRFSRQAVGGWKIERLAP